MRRACRYGVPAAQHAWRDRPGNQRPKLADRRRSCATWYRSYNPGIPAPNITFTGNANVDFVKGMIPHHLGAVEMAKTILAFGKGSRGEEARRDSHKGAGRRDRLHAGMAGEEQSVSRDFRPAECSCRPIFWLPANAWDMPRADCCAQPRPIFLNALLIQEPSFSCGSCPPD